MNNLHIVSNKDKALEPTEFDYDNTDWPRDFDIRVEKSEQQEVFEH